MTTKLPETLTPQERDALPDRIRAVWASAYAAEWAVWFAAAKGPRFDSADPGAWGSSACAVADLAVFHLIQSDRDQGRS